MVNHGILINVLDTAFSVGGKPLDWFISYLYPRTCKVNINESFSSNQDLCFSVPQGILCGPMLYNAYARTVSTIVPSAIATHAYTDDHALKKEFNSSIPQEEAETAQSFSNCLNTVKEWMNSCHLKMNSDKTEVILFGLWQQIKKCRLTAPDVCRETIPCSECIKHLEVFIDCNLRLHHHIASKCKTAMLNLFKIVNIRNFLITKACHTAVVTTVMSHHGWTSRKAHCKAAACPEYGCESCAKKEANTPALQTVFRPYTGCLLGVRSISR